MRFAKYKTERPNESASPPAQEQSRQQQQRSYLQRVRSQIASFRGVYAGAMSTNKKGKKAKKAKKATKQESETASNSSIHDEDSVPRQESVVTARPAQHARADDDPRTAPSGDDAAQEGAGAERAQTQRYFLTWAESRSRLHQASLLIRNACATKSSVLLSGAWPPYLRRAPRHHRPSLSSSDSVTPPPSRHDDADLLAELQWLREQLLSTVEARESEISVRMSYFSSRSLSDPPAREIKHRERASERESDLFRRRCSSADSYSSEYDYRRSRVRSTTYTAENDSSSDSDNDPNDERIRESLFFRASIESSFRVSWFLNGDGELVQIRYMWI